MAEYKGSGNMSLLLEIFHSLPSHASPGKFQYYPQHKKTGSGFPQPVKTIQHQVFTFQSTS
jgi:hypothetical protein